MLSQVADGPCVVNGQLLLRKAVDSHKPIHCIAINMPDDENVAFLKQVTSLTVLAHIRLQLFWFCS